MTEKSKFPPGPGWLAHTAFHALPLKSLHGETHNPAGLRRLSRILMPTCLGLGAGCATQVAEEPQTCGAWSLVTSSPVLLFEQRSPERENP